MGAILAAIATWITFGAGARNRVGFARAATIFIGGPTTGATVNPARAFGPVLYDSFVSRADTPRSKPQRRRPRISGCP